MHPSHLTAGRLIHIKLEQEQGAIVRIPVQNSALLRVDAAMIGRIATPLALTLITATQVLAASPAEQRGKTFVLNNCARCHSIDRVSRSPLKIAPPFRTLHLRYPIETLGEALAEGISTGHPTMPEFRLDPDQIHDLLSYLKTLE